MSDLDLAGLAAQHTLPGLRVPRIAIELAGGGEPELVWRNHLDGLTFRFGERYLKWNPPSTGIDVERELERLEWSSVRHRAPRAVDHGLE